MDEDQILTQVVVDGLLAKLPVWDQEMIILIHRLHQPEWWTGQWPPTYDQIGVYIGTKYHDRPLSEAAIRYRRDEVYSALRGERPVERRPKRRRA